MTFSKEDILSALDKMLEDRRLLVSARNKQFLRFVVKEVLAGRGNRIKAYTVAVDVFGRPANFDGNADAIVRIEASRLRAALAAYYRDPEVEADFEISLPRGSYAPTITPRSERTTEAKRAEREHDSENDLSSGTHGSAVIRRSNIASPPDVHMPDLIGFAPAPQARM